MLLIVMHESINLGKKGMLVMDVQKKKTFSKLIYRIKKYLKLKNLRLKKGHSKKKMINKKLASFRNLPFSDQKPKYNLVLYG